MSLISIITPVFNAEKYLDEVYKSLISQSHTNWEWIVAEDCSSDTSYSILQKIAAGDERVKLFQNSKNSGAALSRNVGLDNARGEYIAFLDADDKWFPEKLELQLAFMKEKSSTFSCHKYEMVDESGKFMKEILVPPLVTLRQLEPYNPLGISFVMVKSSVIGNIRFDVALKRRQDWVFWYHLIKVTKTCESLQKILGSYRKDSLHSISKNKFHMALLQWKMYRHYFHMSFFKAIKSFFQYAFYGVTKHYM